MAIGIRAQDLLPLLPTKISKNFVTGYWFNIRGAAENETHRR